MSGSLYHMVSSTPAIRTDGLTRRTLSTCRVSSAMPSISKPPGLSGITISVLAAIAEMDASENAGGQSIMI